MTPQVISPIWVKANELRDAGYGFEDIQVMLRKEELYISEGEARLIVLGREAYMRWCGERKRR